MTHKTQYEAVLSHLRSRGSLTSLLAFKRYRITRLARVIGELKDRGFLFNTCTVERNGKRYASYSLVI